ncbi:hypothetical protein Bbelb_203160 [Branchiostoma belcheri]|nr:hypothetical protein Bbelb_203160 [Branchiostoma belcheri]
MSCGREGGMCSRSHLLPPTVLFSLPPVTFPSVTRRRQRVMARERGSGHHRGDGGQVVGMATQAATYQGLWVPIPASYQELWVPIPASYQELWVPIPVSYQGLWVPIPVTYQGLWVPIPASYQGLWVPIPATYQHVTLVMLPVGYKTGTAIRQPFLMIPCRRVTAAAQNVTFPEKLLAADESRNLFRSTVVKLFSAGQPRGMMGYLFPLLPGSDGGGGNKSPTSGDQYTGRDIKPLLAQIKRFGIHPSCPHGLGRTLGVCQLQLEENLSLVKVAPGNDRDTTSVTSAPLLNPRNRHGDGSRITSPVHRHGNRICSASGRSGRHGNQAVRASVTRGRTNAGWFSRRNTGLRGNWA